METFHRSTPTYKYKQNTNTKIYLAGTLRIKSGKLKLCIVSVTKNKTNQKQQQKTCVFAHLVVLAVLQYNYTKIFETTYKQNSNSNFH